MATQLISTRRGMKCIQQFFSDVVQILLCRFVLGLPWRVLNIIFEGIITFIFGHPNNIGLNPKMRALQTQPTVSATFVHYVQRKYIQLVGDVQKVNKSSVTFENGVTRDFDAILMCTGYSVNVDFLLDNIREKVLKPNNQLSLYKQVFNPQIGDRLAFIGFVQPSSGGILMCSEIQVRLQQFPLKCFNSKTKHVSWYLNVFGNWLNSIQLLCNGNC